MGRAGCLIRLACFLAAEPAHPPSLTTQVCDGFIFGPSKDGRRWPCYFWRGIDVVCWTGGVGGPVLHKALGTACRAAVHAAAAVVPGPAYTLPRR